MVYSNNRSMVIALDGPAASGKSTVARLLAKTLSFTHLDSGALYRTLTLALMQKLGAGQNSQEFGEKLQAEEIAPETLECTLTLLDSKQVCYIGKQDVSDNIRCPEVTERIGHIADNLKYRNWVNKTLQELSQNTNLVVDGRDIGSVVFPKTPFKFFLEASVGVRAKRRLRDFNKIGHNISLEKLKKEIEKRDRDDSCRTLGALKKMPDAVCIETSQGNPQDIVSHILSHLNSKV